MSSLPIQLQAALIAAFAAIGAALFALVSALINAWVQRKNAELQARTAANIKLAEFRQLWINQLREDFVSLQVKIANNPEEIDKDLAEDLFRILMMLNKGDTSVDEMKKLIGRSLRGEDSARRAAQVELLALLQDVIKKEWQVVKANLGAGAGNDI